MQLVVVAQSAEQVGQVDFDNPFAGPLVFHDQHFVVGQVVVGKDARGHEVGMSHVSYGRRAAADIRVLGIPRDIRCTQGLDAGVFGVVMVQPDVAAGDVEVVVFDIHRFGTVDVAQDDTDVFGVSHQREGVVNVLPLLHLDRLVGNGVPEGVQRLALMVDKPHTVVQPGMVQRNLEVLHAAVRIQLGTLEAAPKLFVAFTLMCQCHEAVLAVGQIQIHVVAILLQGLEFVVVGLGTAVNVVSVLVEDVEGDFTHMVGKHVGTMEVIVVDEVDIHAPFAPVTVVKDKVGTRRNGQAQQTTCQPACLQHIFGTMVHK